MGIWTVKPTAIDRELANAIAARTRKPVERVSGALTWAADEHVIYGAAIAFWLYAHLNKRHQNEANHILATTVVSSIIPHLLKKVFDQERPDRETVVGHWHGVPFSGRRLDAFPSGHAIHLGALASAASTLPTPQRNAVWSLASLIAATRVMLLAHWLTDVMAGAALGAAIERCLRLFTGYGRPRAGHERLPKHLPPAEPS